MNQLEKWNELESEEFDDLCDTIVDGGHTRDMILEDIREFFKKLNLTIIKETKSKIYFHKELISGDLITGVFLIPTKSKILNGGECGFYRTISKHVNECPDLDENDVLNRGYIFCPICGHKIFPEFDGFVNHTIYGEWICYDCSNTFFFVSHEYLTNIAENSIIKQKPEQNENEVVGRAQKKGRKR